VFGTSGSEPRVRNFVASLGGRMGRNSAIRIALIPPGWLPQQPWEKPSIVGLTGPISRPVRQSHFQPRPCVPNRRTDAIEPPSYTLFSPPNLRLNAVKIIAILRRRG
jgi:hypothetical protein